MLKIRTYPADVLSKKTKPVKRIDKDFLRLVDEMFDTMYDQSGIGLAAPQVGESLRFCVVNCTGKEADEITLINPVIVESSGEDTDEEGCLSVPGVRGKITRPDHIKVKAYDRNGREIVIEADGLHARCIQHELDHLNGRLFFQLLNDAARMTVNGQLKTLEDEFVEE